MRTRDLLTETLYALASNKIRTGLTTLGIVIGIASVVSALAIGQGATDTIRASIAALGSNLLVVAPAVTATDSSSNAAPIQIFSEADAAALRTQVNHVSAVAATMLGVYDITASAKSAANSSVNGVESDYDHIRNLTMQNGTFFTSEQNDHTAKVAVIGSNLRDDLFGIGSNPVGQSIRINQLEFKIIGVAAPKGGTEATSTDHTVFIPLRSMRRYLAGNSEPIQSIYISASSEGYIKSVAAEATGLLLERRGISDVTHANFRITNQTDITNSLTTTTHTLTLLLGAVAGISLLVGGIGIMNMMFTSVTERTREIGLRKAIGATQKDIRIQFLTEAVILTILGGLIGIALGLGFAFAVVASHLATAAVTWWSIVLAFGVTSIVGVVFGYYPARRAATLSPIRALTYE